MKDCPRCAVVATDHRRDTIQLAVPTYSERNAIPAGQTKLLRSIIKKKDTSSYKVISSHTKVCFTLDDDMDNR